MANKVLSLCRSATARYLESMIPGMMTGELGSLMNMIQSELELRESFLKKAVAIRSTADVLRIVKVAAYGSLSLHIIGHQDTGKSALVSLYRELGGRAPVFTSWFCPCGQKTSIRGHCDCSALAKAEYYYSWKPFDVTVVQDVSGKSGTVRDFFVDRIKFATALTPTKVKTAYGIAFDPDAMQKLRVIEQSRKLSIDSALRLKRVAAILASYRNRETADVRCVEHASELYWGTRHVFLRND